MKELGRTRSYVDLSRVGIWGWSGGGSNTLNAMFRESDVYHMGIAVAPKPQPHLYNAWFQEIYMETPESNPGGYRRAAPAGIAGAKGARDGTGLVLSDSSRGSDDHPTGHSAAEAGSRR